MAKLKLPQLVENAERLAWGLDCNQTRTGGRELAQMAAREARTLLELSRTHQAAKAAARKWAIRALTYHFGSREQALAFEAGTDYTPEN